jgi:hypothetical protein
MFKRFTVALAALFVLASSAFGAGTLPGFSLSQQMGKDGKPLAGCILKFYQAGTVATPQTAYQDSGLTIPVPVERQLTCDTFGRIGQFFLADGSIKILLTDKNGVTQVTADGLLVIGASSAAAAALRSIRLRSSRPAISRSLTEPAFCPGSSGPMVARSARQHQAQQSGPTRIRRRCSSISGALMQT